MNGNVTFVTEFGAPSTYTMYASVRNHKLAETYTCEGSIDINDDCIEQPYCGDDIVEGTEECEPNTYGGP